MGVVLNLVVFVAFFLLGCLIIHAIYFAMTLPKDRAERADYLRYAFSRSSMGRRIERWRDKRSRR